jgi:membrane-bound lytic murein transglycosylase D
MFSTMRATIVVGVVLAASLGPATAHANPEPEPTHTGAQVPAVHPTEPALAQDLEARRNVRGCDPNQPCARTTEVLREFELEAFPQPGKNPWLDERAPQPSRLETSAGFKRVPRITKPSELRPDQPWLDKLEMPDLPVTWTPKLVDYLMFYKDDPRGRSIMSSWLVAQGRYRDMIVAHLRKAHLPADLLYDAMIESSYDPDDSSSAGALGLWQFMPQGGKIYGLREDRWVDERRDPLRSTIAVLDYWQDLYQRFGDWHIALAAFNAGYGAVLRSIARYNTNDYYQLCEYENGLPWETCLYTPKVLAVAIVGHNRAAFGYDQLKDTQPETWEDVAVPTSMSLAMIAKVAGATEADIKRLNPQLRRGRTPPGEAGYIVRVPPNSKAEFARKLVELQTDWDGFDAYVMAHGERLEDVATTFGVSLGQLKKLNDIQRDAEIEGGTQLVVPRISEDTRRKNREKAKSKLLGSGVDQKDGEALIVPVPDKDATIAGKKRVFYRVVSGDSVKSVAKALGVDAAKLVAWNALDDAGKLHPKMVLVAFVPTDFDADKRGVTLLDEADLAIVTRGSPEHLDLAEARTGRVRTEYVAQAKEKLAEVAKKFGMGSHDLARINRISYDTVLDKGQTIIVYEVKDPSRSKRADDQWGKTPRARRGKVSGQRAQRTASSPTDDSDDTDETSAAGPVTRPDQVEKQQEKPR